MPKENVKNHLVTPILQPFKVQNQAKMSRLNCFWASFFKYNALSRKSLSLSYLNPQIPVPKNLRTPSSWRGSSSARLSIPFHLELNSGGAPATSPIQVSQFPLSSPGGPSRRPWGPPDWSLRAQYLDRCPLPCSARKCPTVSGDPRDWPWPWSWTPSD